MLAERLAAQGILLPSYGMGSRKVKCPHCSAQRRNKSDPCLSVTIDDDGAVWKCHHCGWHGAERDRPSISAQASAPKPLELKPLPAPALAFFKERGISTQTVIRAAIGWARQWIPAKKAEVECIAFPYRLGGKVVNAKFRTLDKEFAQLKDGEKVF